MFFRPPKRKDYSYHAVIYDWDGTVINSISEGMDRITKIVRSVGLPVPEDIKTILRQNWDCHGLDMIQASFKLKPDDTERVYAMWVEFEAKNHYPLIPEALNTLKISSNTFQQVCMLTSRHRATLVPGLQHHELSYFNHIVARDDCKYYKPHRKALDRTLRYLFDMDIYPHNCLMVGDSTVDIACAKACDVTPIGVETGLNTREELIDAGARPENVLPSIANLFEWLVENGC